MRPDTAFVSIHSGHLIDLMNPHSVPIHIDDIAASLSRIVRFNGHTHRPYTVAEHLLLGLEVCPPAVRFRWLAHDFSEAYLGDVTGPLKRSIAMGGYRDLEAAWERALAERFGLAPNPAEAKQVRVVDLRMLLTEQRDLQGRRPLSTDRYPPYALQIPAAAPSADWLRERFLATFYTLAKETQGAKF